MTTQLFGTEFVTTGTQATRRNEKAVLRSNIILRRDVRRSRRANRAI